MNSRGASIAMVATVAIAHRQWLAATAAVPPLGAGPEAMLEVACQLLHNPLGPHALPLAVEQWHHDVDQLIITTINTLPHRRGQVNRLGRALEPSVAHSRSPVVHSSPPVAPCVSSVLVSSLTSVDLWTELEHRRSSEDGCITIERQQERRH
jgi:hypothetical protein